MSNLLVRIGYQSSKFDRHALTLIQIYNDDDGPIKFLLLKTFAHFYYQPTKNRPNKEEILETRH